MSQSPKTIALSGSMTLAEAARWHEALLGAIAEGQDLRIDLAASGPWDLAGLQLLLAALASGRESGRSVRLARVPRVLLAVAEQAAVDDRLAGAIESRL